MARKKTLVNDAVPPKPTPEGKVKENRKTLAGPGPCASCGGAKFNHVPYGGIRHPFVQRSDMERAVRVAVREGR